MSQQVTVQIKRLPHGEGLALPAYATEDSSGLDLPAAIEQPVTLAPGERCLIPTGFCLALPSGFEAQLRPRSGLALKQGLTVLNSPGTVDADYRGEVSVLLINLGQAAVTLERGMRIAQMVVQPVARARLELTEELPDSGRGAGGYGSTGTAAISR